LSYRQTVRAYPEGGGAYAVSSGNLGPSAGLLAAAALLADYILTVAVSISAGTLAIVSALPWLSPFAVVIALTALSIVALVNLRGVRESGTVFAVPTYVFIAIFGLLIIGGLTRVALGNLAPLTHDEGRLPGQAVETFSLLLLLRAFASGAS